MPVSGIPRSAPLLPVNDIVTAPQKETSPARSIGTGSYTAPRTSLAAIHPSEIAPLKTINKSSPSIFKTPFVPTIRPGQPPRNNPQPAPRSRRPPSASQTRYVDMLLGLDTISRLHNLLASFCTWILLAGFIVIPGTPTSIERNKKLREGAKHNKVEHAVLNTVQHASLMWIEGVCCAIGGSEISWLWWRWRGNYVGVLNKIFSAGALNSVAGLISTLVGVDGQHGGEYSITARATLIVTACCTVSTTALFLLYRFWILQGVEKRHLQETGAEWGREDYERLVGGVPTELRPRHRRLDEIIRGEPKYSSH